MVRPALFRLLHAESRGADVIGTSSDDLMPEWKDLGLAPALKRGLWGLGFTKPTEIQKRAVPFALGGRDVVGVAETVIIVVGSSAECEPEALNHLLFNPIRDLVKL